MRAGGIWSRNARARHSAEPVRFRQEFMLVPTFAHARAAAKAARRLTVPGVREVRPVRIDG